MATYEIKVPDGRTIKVRADSPEQALEGAEEWAAANPARENRSMVESAINGVASGLTLGFDDEIAAGLQTGFGLIGDYDETVSEFRKAKGEMAADNPTTNLVGNIAGGLGAGVGMAANGATLLGRTAGRHLLTRMGAGAAEGAAYGAGYGAGNADGGDRMQGAIDGAIVGGTIGGAIPGVGAAATKYGAPVVQKIGNKIRPEAGKRQAAVDLVTETARKAGLSQDDLIQGVREGRSIGQQDGLLSDLTRAVKRQPGEARKIIENSLDEGYAANNAAALDDLSQGLKGPENFYKWRDSFAKAKSRDAAPAYAKAFQENWGSKGPPFALDNLMNSGRIPSSAVKEAIELARIEGRPFGKNLIASIDDNAGTVSFKRLPSLEEAEIIRRGLKGATTKAYKDGSAKAPALKSLELEMRGIIDDASPALRDVRKQYATFSQIQEAGDVGLTLLNRSADEVEFLLEGMSAAERQSARNALSSVLKDKVERGLINRDAVKNIFGSTQKQRILANLWDDKKSFDAFRKQMENRAEFSAHRQNVQGNSRTQQDLADTASLGGGLGGAVRNLATGNIKGAAIDAIMTIVGRTVNPAKGLPEETLKRAAQILTETNPKMADALIRRALTGDRSAGDRLARELQKLLSNPRLQQSAVAPSAAIGAR